MGGETSSETTPQFEPVPFAEAARFWVKLGFISFGGPAGQIAIMQTECVDKRRWIGQHAFLSGLNYCMLLPGPEAQQLAAYIGWRMHGIKGALVAGTAFVVPGVFLIVFLAWLAAAHGDSTLIKAAFSGVKPVVVAIVIQALWRIGKRTCNTPAGVAMAAAAFAALYFAGIPFPAVIVGAGAIGMAATRVPGIRFSSAVPAGEAPARAAAGQGLGGQVKRLALLAAVFLLLWVVPVGTVIWAFGAEPFAGVARLFTTAAFVTFGGAYAVLPYIADAGVNTYGWLTPGDMVNGLALAETTPGPLILVTTYVGYFAGWNGAAAGLAPGAAGLLGAVLTTYVTFLPCFLFIIAGAPYVERVQTLAWARGALAAITAAVVGVILNLTVFLGGAVLLPEAGGVEWTAVAVCALAFALLAWGRISIPWLVVLGALFGLAQGLLA